MENSMKEYPSESDLKYISEWKISSKEEMLKFLEFLEETWNTEQGIFKLTGKKVLKLRLVTGGWSGNEDIIRALSETDSSMFWRCFWEMSRCGGLHCFEIRIDGFFKKGAYNG